MKPEIRLTSFLTFLLLPLLVFHPGQSALRVDERPSGIPESAEPIDGWPTQDSSAWHDGDQLFLNLRNEPLDGFVRLPRLANVIRSIHWRDDPDNELKLQPEPTEWIISASPSAKLRASSPSRLVLVLQLDAPPRVFDESIINEPNSDGTITLPAKNAVTRGETLRFEPQPHKNTVGYWSNETNFAEWHYRLQAPGQYEIDILQGCGKGHGGSKVSCKTESGTLEFEVQETGHFQNFIWRTVGTLELKATENSVLSLIPVHQAAGAVMDVRAIRIVPTGMERSFDPELADPTSLPEKR